MMARSRENIPWWAERFWWHHGFGPDRTDGVLEHLIYLHELELWLEMVP